MLILLISCFSFVLLSKSLSLKPLPPWASETRLLYICSWKEVLWLLTSALTWFGASFTMHLKNKYLRTKVKNVDDVDGSSLLDLPELALECILEKLQPNELCKMAQVCRSLRDRCRTDYLWKKHMKRKWGKVIGDVACREWKLYNTIMKNTCIKKKRSFVRSLSCACSLSWVGQKSKKGIKSKNALPADSIMSWYLCLESGKFWLPAQVYNRENGHVGFMLSCYDAQLCYDSFSDTFQARYPPHGPRAPVIEEYVQWDRIRAPPIDKPPHDLHASDCLDDLHPGDHIEIQWRRNKEFPYGWWYGVVGHLEACHRIYFAGWALGVDKVAACTCHKNDSVVLEFNQYSPGSRWRKTTVNRKDHREEGSSAEGFYGGIRKIYGKEQITVWKNLWPKDAL